MPGRDSLPSDRYRTGKGMGRRSASNGMNGARPGAGPGGSCVCPNCGAKTEHQAGVPCFSVNCPKCGTKMIRG